MGLGMRLEGDYEARGDSKQNGQDPVQGRRIPCHCRSRAKNSHLYEVSITHVGRVPQVKLSPCNIGKVK